MFSHKFNKSDNYAYGRHTSVISNEYIIPICVSVYRKWSFCNIYDFCPSITALCNKLFPVFRHEFNKSDNYAYSRHTSVIWSQYIIIICVSVQRKWSYCNIYDFSPSITAVCNKLFAVFRQEFNKSDNYAYGRHTSVIWNEYVMPIWVSGYRKWSFCNIYDFCPSITAVCNKLFAIFSHKFNKSDNHAYSKHTSVIWNKYIILICVSVQRKWSFCNIYDFSPSITAVCNKLFAVFRHKFNKSDNYAYGTHISVIYNPYMCISL